MELFADECGIVSHCCYAATLLLLLWLNAHIFSSFFLLFVKPHISHRIYVDVVVICYG